MKRQYAFFLSLFFLAACNKNELPKGVLEEQKMVRILADLTVIDGYMSTLMYADSIRMNGKNYYATVYKNHNISKAAFDSSMKYYSKQPVLLDSMYSKVDSLLLTQEKRLMKMQELEQKKLIKSK
ncbi:MAG: DUF4296 domain-containing protein [Daejeonella sp.]|uniref:DUF4296 domain-containing protein n=1 Tax=Daejeonella sp. JGW-45 TaxID=3034148 RepID=UPI0023EBCF98|nr:DUF4296 domain-containing protein [Daejeonella sp. JGW-45]